MPQNCAALFPFVNLRVLGGSSSCLSFVNLRVLRGASSSLLVAQAFDLPASFCSMISNARRTSFTKSAKSTASTDFLGLMTTSALDPAIGRVSRTASRRRRFIRLRCTAPPSARPTVNPMRRARSLRPLPVKHRHRRRKMPPALLVHSFKISVPQQSGAAGKAAAGPRLDISLRFSWHTGSPVTLNLQVAAATSRSQRHDRNITIAVGLATAGGTRRSSAPLNYSRKPGFTETRLRPLARRREITFLPPWVFMRVRNPCIFDRLRRLGWNVRLGRKVARPAFFVSVRANRKYKSPTQLPPIPPPNFALPLAHSRRDVACHVSLITNSTVVPYVPYPPSGSSLCPVATSLRPITSREAAKDCSPRRKPWGEYVNDHQPRRGERKIVLAIFATNLFRLHRLCGSYHRAT